jgi:hypothetical protein
MLMADNPTHSEKPTHIVYAVREFENDDGADPAAVKIGVGFDRLDGRGVDLVFDALPLSGRIALRIDEARWDENNAQAMWEHRKREYRLTHPRRFDRLQPL